MQGCYWQYCSHLGCFDSWMLLYEPNPTLVVIVEYVLNWFKWLRMGRVTNLMRGHFQEVDWCGCPGHEN